MLFGSLTLPFLLIIFLVCICKKNIFRDNRGALVYSMPIQPGRFFSDTKSISSRSVGLCWAYQKIASVFSDIDWQPLRMLNKNAKCFRVLGKSELSLTSYRNDQISSK